MKQILILILTFSLFSCSKDEKSNTLSSQKSEQDVFNAVVGTWNFNQMGYDPEFKKTKDLKLEECAKKKYTIMRSDGTITAVNSCYDKEDRTGTFYIEFGGSFKGDTNVNIRTVKGGLNLIPDMGYSDGGILYGYTDSTLIFPVHYQDTLMYSELKRVK